MDAGPIELGRAPLVFCGGGGVQSGPALRRAAAVCGAAVGGTANLCNDRVLPRTLLIGASGTILQARTYVAFGVAGAPHHLAGLEGVPTVVSVNHDPRAPINMRADYIFIADSNKVLDVLGAAGTRKRPSRTSRTRGSPLRGGKTRVEELLLPASGRRIHVQINEPIQVVRSILGLTSPQEILEK